MTHSAVNQLGVPGSARRRTQRWVGAVWLLTVLLLACGWYAERHPALQLPAAWLTPHFAS
jgi:hypothetical protein